MAADAGTLATIASITAAFGAAMLVFRVQREDQMRQAGERVWLPVADWLLLGTTLICLLFVILPIAAGLALQLPAAGSAASAVAVAGYIPAILAHYRIVFGSSRTGPRSNPEPLELAFVLVTVLAACSAGLWVYCHTARA